MKLAFIREKALHYIKYVKAHKTTKMHRITTHQNTKITLKVILRLQDIHVANLLTNKCYQACNFLLLSQIMGTKFQGPIKNAWTLDL
jgi:hypothetical protein